MDESTANPDFSVALFVSFLIPILAAYVLALPIGLNGNGPREARGYAPFPWWPWVPAATC